MNKQCCDFIQNELGIRTIQVNNLVAAFEGLSGYDVITLWQVMEHLPDPWSTLKAAVEKLLPGGILVISAPNPASFQFRVLGRFWTHVDAPRHLTLIPSDNAARYAHTAASTALRPPSRQGIVPSGWSSGAWQSPDPKVQAVSWPVVLPPRSMRRIFS